jgi:hypothetical protein
MFFISPPEIYGVHTSLEKPKSVALAPLPPRHLLQVGEPAQRSGSQFWGELDYILSFLPPKLGGGGANAGLNDSNAE